MPVFPMHRANLPGPRMLELNSPPANFELSFALPLGVVANQLMKVEAELRFLSARAGAYASGSPAGDVPGQVAARLEQINEALEVIRALMQDIEAGFQPKSMRARPLEMHTDRDD